MNKFLKFFSSFSFMGFLLLVMAFSLGIATFIENNFGTEAAHALIYNSLWFELVLALLATNLIANFVSFKMYTPKRISVGIFHLAFILILIGAGLTRYISFEGVMHIRKGQSSNLILSAKDYLTIKNGNHTITKSVLFSELTPHRFDEKIIIEGRKVRIRSIDFVKNAVCTIQEDPSGQPMIDLVISQGNGQKSHILSEGSTTTQGNIRLGFDQPDANFQFINRAGKLFFTADRQIEIRSMTDDNPQMVNAYDTVPVQPMQLYAFDHYQLLVKKFYNKAVEKLGKGWMGDENQDAVALEISDGSNTQVVNVQGKHGMPGETVKAQVGNSVLEISYGANPIQLPFSLQLTDFQIDKYPGSMSPSSYSSELVLIDKERNITRNARVFMNNTLTYRGYKFFQSSYDQDEAGTILSVSADRLGTTTTYIGYLILGLGFILALFSKYSRFYKLTQQLKQYSKPAGLILLLFLLKETPAFAQNSELNAIPRIDRTVLNDFSQLWIQEPEGRIEPVSTLASDVLRKISRKSDLNGRTPEEVMLELYMYPDQWKKVPLIYITNDQLKRLLGTTESRIPLSFFFDDQGNYKLAGEIKLTYAKMPAFRNMYEKELINADERVNICFMVISGDMFTLFPGSSKDVKWAVPGSNPLNITSEDSLFVNKSFEKLKESMEGKTALTTKQIIKKIATYQKKYALSYLPSDSKKEAEIFYNSIHPFKRVFPVYLSLGFVLLVILFVNIFRQKTINNKLKLVFSTLIFTAFLFHTAGLALRWYISGHAPWSNGFESMVYVAWASMLAGIIFGRKYPMVIGTAAMLSGIILFVAHLSWMNPEITHLVPVLKSYWLMFHVAIITASYGFIGISAFIGLLVLLMYCMSTPKNSENIKTIVLQLSTINEMSVIVGLYMLTIGTFLGGVWANESWGRYWGWDSKETWALVTVVVYAFIAHMRMIPSLKGIFNFTVATVLGFSSVLMTYLGVNYYLSGLHSYGRGSVDSIHWSVYLIIALVTGLLIFANFKQKNLDFEN
jgi:cytochrome c-type biogenesis protein CcsB